MALYLCYRISPKERTENGARISFAPFELSCNLRNSNIITFITSSTVCLHQQTKKAYRWYQQGHRRSGGVQHTRPH